ncbi:MAG: DUF2062 domain-containing protein [Rhodobacteraceae bacterium]|nr:DUF2062 domain-containing protein [Paracoccaceae bacterium]
MMFKRRKKLSWTELIVEGIYPKAGWRRAISYVAHRLRRLPDTPSKIARGVGLGVFVSFTPFFGLHFFIATLLAVIFRGNVLASLLATFVGNPLTFPFIVAGNLTLGHLILGRGPDPAHHKSFFRLFGDASWDFWSNFKALFTDDVADWTYLGEFMSGVFLPYLVGGLVPGVVLGLLAYFLSRPVIAAYQHRRKGRLLARFKERRGRVSRKADEAQDNP